MIWRGLQMRLAACILCMIALGAASSLGQTYSRSNHPAFVTISGVTFPEYNGVYQWIGSTSVSGGATLAKYDQTSGTRWLTVWEEGPSILWFGLHSGDPGSSHTSQRVAFARVDTQPHAWPTSAFGPWSVGFGGQGIMSMSVVTDPYELAFPDWESAALKIPLGFAFAMSFWGVAVAASMGMKWVKELASAAS